MSGATIILTADVINFVVLASTVAIVGHIVVHVGIVVNNVVPHVAILGQLAIDPEIAGLVHITIAGPASTDADADATSRARSTDAAFAIDT